MLSMLQWKTWIWQKTFPHHKMSVSLQLQRMRKQKEKNLKCVEVYENSWMPQSLQAWFSESGKEHILSLSAWQRTFKVSKMLFCILTRTFRALYSLYSYEHPGSLRSQSYKLLAWNPWKSTLFYHFNCHSHDWSTCWRQHSTISYSGTQDLFVHVTDEQLDPSNHLQ